jgi:hypothetical protein
VAGGYAAVAPPLRLGFRRNAGPTKPCTHVGALVMPRGEAQVLGWLGKQAEGEVHRGDGNGGRQRGAGSRKGRREGFK